MIPVVLKIRPIIHYILYIYYSYSFVYANFLQEKN